MTDILIIGGGIAGVSAAAALSAEAEVTLLEAEPALGYHASGRSAAMFEENYGNAAVRALNHASKPALEAAGVLSPRGILMVARAEEAEAFETDAEHLGLHPIPVAEALARVPILAPDIAHAALHTGAMDIDTDRLLQGCARQARTHGARIVTGARIETIRHDGRWQVHAGDHVHRADILVNAAGAWADAVARMAGVPPLGLMPYRRSMARLPAPGGHDVRSWPMLLGLGESWYAKPDAGGWIVSPADQDPLPPQDAWAEDIVIAEGIARYQAYVTEIVTRVETTWAGLRTFAADRTPVIGSDRHVGSFFWLAGQGGYGFQTAPAAAALLADLILLRSPALDTATVNALSPVRSALGTPE